MKRVVAFVLVGLLLAVGLFWLTGRRVTDLMWLVVGMIETLGFETEVVVPERPPPVPETAVWAGGVDGGAWIKCSLDREQHANWCTTWNDQTGAVWARTHFVLRDTGQPIPESELNYASFDGVWIWLVDGRALEPLRFHGVKRDPWEAAPIDPPRIGPASE